MLRWTVLRQTARILRRACLASPLKQSPSLDVTKRGGARWYAGGTIEQTYGARATSTARKRIKPVDLDTTARRRRADAWLALLEPTLPPHLRDRSASPGPELSAPEIFEVLSQAEKALLVGRDRDVLSYIANERGRWDLLVWLVKHLVGSFSASISTDGRSTRIISPWKNDRPLDELTQGPVDPLHSDFLQPDSSNEYSSISLEEGTADGGHDTLSHNVLGMIWRSLGSMTVACADGDIKPEILEIIACLHHQGFMPSSIYDSKPSCDPTAIQQSPILNLLSSRILTSLSDAAWRAHAKLIVEEAKDRGGDYASLQYKIPGSAYRVRVAGLKPEVWLELILWACLHGGWINDGIKVLKKLHSMQWRPLSWRSLVSQQPTGARDWERVEYLFNNWTLSSMDLEEPATPVSVQRTVSSEVVNAYVDASVSVTRTSSKHPGRSISQTIQFITAMQLFLARSSLGLGAGSWDAIILRLFDQQDDIIYRPTTFDRVIRLSPTLGQEASAINSQSLPDYVFDGTAAVLGLFHRALHFRIKQADVEGALRLFASLQEHADENKRRSVADFLRKQNLFANPDHQKDTGRFTDNYGSIDYPAFYVQIPPTILGPFLELVTDAKAYEFGKWLLYSEEVDGPVVPESLYGDASITPALVRFAAETGDKVLLSKLIKMRAAAATDDEPTLPRKVLQSFLDSQINLMRWDAALKILQHMKDTHGFSWNALTLCHLLRASLLQVRKAEAGDKVAYGEMTRARGIFRQLVRGGYDREGERPDFVQEQVDNLLVVLARVGGEWAGFSVNTQSVRGYRVFNLSSKAFNLVLEGVVDAYGSQAGRKLIGIFWNHQVRSAQSRESESERQATSPPFSSFGRTLPEHLRRQRTEVRFPGPSGRKVVIYAGLRPDLMTIRIVLKKAIEEFVQDPAGSGERTEKKHLLADSRGELAEAELDQLIDKQDRAIDLSSCDMVIWGARCLKRLGMTVEDLEEELKRTLSESKFKQVLEKSPDLLSPVKERGNGNGEDGEDVDDEREGGARDEAVPVQTEER